MKKNALYHSAPAAGSLFLIVAMWSHSTSEPAASVMEATEVRAQESPRTSRRCFPEARLDQHLIVLSHQSGVSITALGDIGAERVSIFDDNIDLEVTLDKIAKSKGWTWFRFDDGSYAIASEEWYRANLLGPCMSPTKVFRPDHLRASELESSIRALLTPGTGRMNFDDRTNKIIIVDSHDSIARIERFIREVDQPPAP